MKEKHRVYVLGSINMDMVMHAARLPVTGETIFGTGFDLNAGGKGANQAIAVQKSGADMKFCACVGGDVFGKQLVSDLRRYGVDTEFVFERKETSGLAQITVIDGNNSIIVYGGANLSLTEEDIEKFLQDAEAGDYLLLQLEIRQNIAEYVMKRGKEKKMICVLNPAPAENFKEEMFQYTDILIPNETEAISLGGEADLKGACGTLKEKVGTLIVTTGKRGCLIYEGKHTEAIPCPQVKVVDTTAAGDTFCGALVAKLSRNETLRNAVDYALKAASLAVTKKGAQQSVPAEEEVVSFYGEK